MSLIRQRKKKLLMAGIAGAAISIIFLSALFVVILYVYPGIKKENQIKKEENYKEVYQLAIPLKAGDIITGKDIQPVKLPDSLMPSDVLISSDIVGKRLKLSLGERTIITRNFVYSGNAMEQDLRLHQYNFITVTNKLKAGDYIDIRISFGNGADFILLAKKRVEDLSIQSNGETTINSLWLMLTEEELLRVSSAVVDAYLNKGCSIYAIEYVSELQEEAIVNYPVNEVVEKLIAEDPNIVTKAENVMKSKLRNQLELQRKKDQNSVTILDKESDKTQNLPDDFYPETTSSTKENNYVE
jgi:hypothetical protein